MLGRKRRPAVERLADAVEDPAEQPRTDMEAQRLAEEAHARALQGKPGGVVEHLDRDGVPIQGGDAPETHRAVRAFHLDRLVQAHVEAAAQEQQRTLGTAGDLFSDESGVCHWLTPAPR